MPANNQLFLLIYIQMYIHVNSCIPTFKKKGVYMVLTMSAHIHTFIMYCQAFYVPDIDHRPSSSSSLYVRS